MTALTVSAVIASGRVELVNVRQRSLLIAKCGCCWCCAAFAAARAGRGAADRLARPGRAGAAPAVDGQMRCCPPRGEITDRNGVPLARAFPAYALWYNPEALGDGGTPLVKSRRRPSPRELKAIFPDLDEAELARRLAAGKPGYLRRRVLPEDANRVHAIGELGARAAARDRPPLSARLDGRARARLRRRRRPGPGRHGSGARRAADAIRRPRGTPGRAVDRRARAGRARGRARPRACARSTRSARPGIVLDVDTGEVLALASLPAFDPNRIDAGRRAQLIFNRVTNQVYELGSTFKPLTVAAAIDAGTVTDLGAPLSGARRSRSAASRSSDSHALGASLNVPEMLIHSSNVVTAHIVDELGRGAAEAGRWPTSASTSGRTSSCRRAASRSGRAATGRGCTAMTVGYGHGIAVTPLHLATRLCGDGQRRHLAPGDAAASSRRARCPRAGGCSRPAPARG